jgi:hypothetical protein
MHRDTAIVRQVVTHSKVEPKKSLVIPALNRFKTERRLFWVIDHLERRWSGPLTRARNPLASFLPDGKTGSGVRLMCGVRS